ncbi:hypothetical protein [Streptomyces scopuliridis]|uniref:hypothetical protein n=1 Tax=Streptomyces scopuliridis TaxID=452529 RepID=UPI003899BFFE
MSEQPLNDQQIVEVGEFGQQTILSALGDLLGEGGQDHLGQDFQHDHDVRRLLWQHLDRAPPGRPLRAMYLSAVVSLRCCPAAKA